MKNNNTKKLAACAVMVALGAVLSMIKVLQMPFGGSITLLSMLPCAMISIMYGLKWGFGGFLCGIRHSACVRHHDGRHPRLGHDAFCSHRHDFARLHRGIHGYRHCGHFPQEGLCRHLLRHGAGCCAALCVPLLPAPLSLQTLMSLCVRRFLGGPPVAFTPSATTALTCCRSSSSQLSRRLFCSVCRR